MGDQAADVPIRLIMPTGVVVECATEAQAKRMYDALTAGMCDAPTAGISNYVSVRARARQLQLPERFLACVADAGQAGIGTDELCAALGISSSGLPGVVKAAAMSLEGHTLALTRTAVSVGRRNKSVYKLIPAAPAPVVDSQSEIAAERHGHGEPPEI